MREQLEQMLLDLQTHKHKREELYEYYIQDRLAKSLKTYYKEVSSSLRFYKDKDELKILEGLAGT